MSKKVFYTHTKINLMELTILERFGLNHNDIVVYKALLTIGRSKTGAIMHQTGISSSSTYASLASLVSRGLVSYQVRNNVKYYQAEMPEQLLEETKKQAHALEKIMQEIVFLPIQHAERNEVNLYQGVQGFKRAFEVMAGELKAGEMVSVITYSTHYGKSKSVRQFFAALDRRILVQTKCKINIVVDEDLKKIITEDRNSFAKRYTFRCLPKEYFSPCCVNISDSMVVLGVWGKNPIAFTIRNHGVIDSFRSNFNFLWDKGKK